MFERKEFFGLFENSVLGLFREKMILMYAVLGWLSVVNGKVKHDLLK